MKSNLDPLSPIHSHTITLLLTGQIPFPALVSPVLGQIVLPRPQIHAHFLSTVLFGNRVFADYNVVLLGAIE